MKTTTLNLTCTLSFLLMAAGAHAQLTLEDCYDRATENYPMIKQQGLIQKAKDFAMRNATMGYLPAVSLNGQQSYQSDVTSIPALQDVRVPIISKNQYKVYADIVAPLYDGGAIRQQKQQLESNAKVEEGSLEVELYKLRARVNDLFFGVLLLDGQLQQQKLLVQDIKNGLRKTNAAIVNGAALKSSGLVLEAELLKTKQSTIELQASRSAYIQMLELMIGRPIGEATIIVKPTSPIASSEVMRPELKLYHYQASAIDIERKRLNTLVTPKLSAFFQGGYGKPALNMLNTEADSYYIAGIKLNWNLTGFYTRKTEKELLEVRRSTINIQRETFLFNNDYQSRQQRSEVDKLAQLQASDDEIIALRTRVKETASAQLENGVIDSNDYLLEVNEENAARQSKVIHEVQLLQAQYDLKTTKGIQ